MGCATVTANSTILQTGTDNFPTERIHRQSFLGWVETLLGLHSRASTCVRNNRIRPFHPPTFSRYSVLQS
jgi:hypothetical protein